MDVSAQEIQQVRRQHRLGYTRAPSWLARVANNVQDYSETFCFPEAGAKNGGVIAFCHHIA